jgi:hypothetical protein
MSLVIELLAKLRARDVRLEVDGDLLRYDAPKGVLTPDLLAEMVEYKAGLIELLRSGADPSPADTRRCEWCGAETENQHSVKCPSCFQRWRWPVMPLWMEEHRN